MKVRELLQIELWSKITSRKICIGIGIVIVGLFSWCEVEKYWLTPGERDAGWTALAQIEELEKLQIDTSDKSIDLDWVPKYDAAQRRARSAVSIAELRAWTVRDRQFAVMLSRYLWSIEDFRIADLLGNSLSDGAGKISPEQVTNAKRFKQKERSEQFQLFGYWRSEAHKFLD